MLFPESGLGIILLSMIRKRLQRILACIFALRIFDNGEKKCLYIKNLQEEGRKAKKTQENCQCLPSGAQSHVISIDSRTSCHVW